MDINWDHISKLIKRKKIIAGAKANRFLILVANHTGKMKEKNRGSGLKLPRYSNKRQSERL